MQTLTLVCGSCKNLKPRLLLKVNTLKYILRKKFALNKTLLLILRYQFFVTKNPFKVCLGDKLTQ